MVSIMMMKPTVTTYGRIARGRFLGRCWFCRSLVLLLLLLLLQSTVLTHASKATAAAAAAAATTTTSSPFPNPETDPDACHGDVNTTNRVCDVDGMLGLSQMRAIQNAIVQYEMFNVTCHGQVFPIQMGVYVVDRMKTTSGTTNLAKRAQQMAEQIHDEWGVGYPTSECGGTGVVMFLSFGDHQMYISRGKAIRSVLNDDRLKYIMDKMKPDLRNRNYGTAIELGIHLITEYIAGSHPDWDDSKDGLLGFLVILSAFGIFVKCASWYQSRKQRTEKRMRDEFRDHLKKLDHDQARALQGKYRATSCPICLEDFTITKQPKDDGETQIFLHDGNNNNDHDDQDDGPDDGGSGTVYGCDGKPVQLLSCGHVFDQKCWNEFIGHSTDTITARPFTDDGLCCPICRQPVTPIREESTIEHCRPAVVNDRTYQGERRYRLQRLQYRYPTYVGTRYVDQWYDPYYRGSMVEDHDRFEREREVRRAAQRAAAQHHHQSTSGGGYTTSGGFGGGSADGGGVGSSW